MVLEYTVRRSAKRTKLSIIIERDCQVVVLAPSKASDSAIDSAVQSKRQWIYEKMRHEQKFKSLPHPPGKELTSGEGVLYLGQSYRIELVDPDAEVVCLDAKIFIPKLPLTQRKQHLYDWYFHQAKLHISPRAKDHAKKLGVTYKKVKIVDNQYRWGSCTVKNNINFNWRLIKAPMIVIDYVIVHELAHLLEANHTPKFWNILRAQSPHIEKAKNWLKSNGQILEEKF